jgi:outer membrane protein OmpA-like peptidoglycan-associated protein
LLRACLDSRITNALGFGSLQSMLGSTSEDTRPAAAATSTQSAPRSAYATASSRPSEGRRWMPWAIAAVIAALLLGFLATRMGGGDRTQNVTGTLPASVYFEVGDAGLKDQDRRTIATVASSVKGSDAPLTITGYTDSSGNPDQNMELAKNRAMAVRDALVQEGVPASRVMMAPPTTVTGTGSPDDARRVEIRLAEK